MKKPAKNTICLWYDGDAEDAAQFYAKTFPDSSVDAVYLAPGDYPSGKKGDVLTVEFTVLGIPCIGLNGGPTFKHSEAFSFQVATEIKRKLIAIGMQLLIMVVRKASVGGVETSGDCPGRLLR